jgi:hypothetical protein
MSHVEQFMWGFFGSVAVEVVTLVQYYTGSYSQLPQRYREVAFYLIRIVLAIVAGGLVIAYNIEQTILAINIGAATPLIIKKFSERPPQD